MTGAVTLRLQESPVLWVIEAAYDRTAWWRKRLDLGWLDVRRLDGGQEVETFEFPVPQSLAIDVGVDNEPAGLQLMARWNARQFPTLVIATLDPAASSAATWLRSAGAIDLIVGWGDVARSQRLIERFWKVHRPAVSDPYDMVARRLPGRFR